MRIMLGIVAIVVLLVGLLDFSPPVIGLGMAGVAFLILTKASR